MVFKLYMWKLYNGIKKWPHPIKLQQDFGFPQIHKQEGLVHHANNTLSRSLNSYVWHLWRKQFHSKIQVPLVDILLAILIANYLPFDKTPYKINTQLENKGYVVKISACMHTFKFF